VSVLLIVDDEQIDRELFRNILQRQGHTILEASNYSQAVETFDRHSRQVDLLIADVALPERNGCELAKHLLGIEPQLGVLFVSGFVGYEVCKQYGIPVSDLHFLPKPFVARELVARVDEILNSPRNSPFPVPGEGRDLEAHS
jgi:DNA-binding response OmpR family regulator